MYLIVFALTLLASFAGQRGYILEMSDPSTICPHLAVGMCSSPTFSGGLGDLTLEECKSDKLNPNNQDACQCSEESIWTPACRISGEELRKDKYIVFQERRTCIKICYNKLCLEMNRPVILNIVKKPFSKNSKYH